MKLSNVERYHRLKNQINRIIKQNAKLKKAVFYGSSAINQQMPKEYLQMPTDDYDLYADNPKQTAQQVEKEIDRLMKFDSMEVRQAKYPKTYKLKSKVTGKTRADYTKPDSKVPYVIIGGQRYANLNYIKNQKKKTLKEGIATHRLLKDQDQLARIQIAQSKTKPKPQMMIWRGAEKVTW